ncbi:MAG TPA: beta-ketoacyl synthase N-terminal-like domain-containing protein [Longimicrobiaceae bacterium]|nr:beta-ketoacyl synthase N-terminal-like domain-containing protein [Longimicrobiaceae bacterium]
MSHTLDPGYESSLTGMEIAVIGMAGRFPGAEDLDVFWRNLVAGTESISRFSPEALERAGIPREVLDDPAYVPAGGEIPRPDLFDAAFFGFTEREAEITDPQQRILLECAWEALESAGYDPARYPGQVGVFAGSGSTRYLNVNLATNPELIAVAGSMEVSLANETDFLTTRVSYKLDLHGPSVPVRTACSSGLVATHLACRSLLGGECDMALAGGVSVTHPTIGYRFQEGGISSPDGHCRAFDAEARGSVASSGAGVVLLKRLEDALADGDPIHAVIRGSAINNDGARKIGFTAPSVEGQARVIADALAVAEVDPSTIGFMEGHGSGTPLGDSIEITALKQVFVDGSRAARTCALGSVKSNLGHCNAAAGVAGLIKAVLSVKHGVIPPTVHFRSADPRLELDGTPLYVNAAPASWEVPGPRRAGVSSFGIGGTNAHVVLEEPPALVASGPGRGWQLLTLSARTDAALAAMRDNLRAHLVTHPDLPLADVAYTLHVGRAEMEHRLAAVCRDREDALRALAGEDAGVVTGRVRGESGGQRAALPPAGARGDELRRALLETARAWAGGAEVDWTALHQGERRRRVPLPTYPFERRSYWVHPRAPAALTRPGGGGEAPDPAGEAARAPRRAPRPAVLTEYVAPGSELEAKVAEVWEELLGIQGIGAYDNFLELGGHSLLGIRVLARLREHFGVDLPPEALYTAPTVSDMAAMIEAMLLAEIEAMSEDELLGMT